MLALSAAVAFVVLAAPAVASAAVPWCGNDQLSSDRPDVVGGRKIHVIYAIPSDGADRFAAAASAITTDIAAMLAWWGGEDPSSVPRFDLFAFPGCATAVGNLDISFVRLGRPASAYHVHAGRLFALAQDLAREFDDPAKKYLVFYDAPVADEDVCGSAFGRDDPGEGGAFAVAGIYVQNRANEDGCGLLGLERYTTLTIAHELLHMFGAVPAPAPNACADDKAHICNEPTDVMSSGNASAVLAEVRLDPGRDDYYGHDGAWQDAQDSPWLARTALPDRRLAVEIRGAVGRVAVTSSLPGIDCPRTCSLPWAGGDSLELEVDEGLRSRFLRWEGACARRTCTLTMDADKRVRAVFGPAFYAARLSVAGSGSIVSDAGATCRRTCTAELRADARIIFRARAARGWRLAGWRGACASARNRPRCAVDATRPLAVGAVFRRVS